jgi:putative radical SAM enzyme (TIGR03279 family)
LKSVIKSVERGSPISRKAKVGERLVSINGHIIHDVLDYKYYAYDRNLVIELESPDGGIHAVRVRKSEGEDLGLEFETYLMDRARSCANRCVFCFVDQLPQGMRPTMYFKDDDARLSFLTGNYITLTNLSERELQRIIDLRISPINVSVHATEPALRAKLLGCPRGAEGYAQMQRLAAGGITMNCQIVCCPGLNDGEQLSRTMQDLAVLYPKVRSVSVVPVGLTKYREGLYPLTPFDRKKAEETVARVNAFGLQCLEQYGSRIFFCADELYLKAKQELPDEEYYEGYPQIENGVGLLRSMQEEFRLALRLEENPKTEQMFCIATGVAAAPFMQDLLEQAMERFDNVHGYVYAIQNDFFGHTIDVAGLITGGDLIRQLRGRPLGNRILIPQTMLRHGEGVFLDDITLQDVERELGAPVRPVMQDGYELLLAMLGEDSSEIQ